MYLIPSLFHLKEIWGVLKVFLLLKRVIMHYLNLKTYTINWTHIQPKIEATKINKVT